MQQCPQGNDRDPHAGLVQRQLARQESQDGEKLLSVARRKHPFELSTELELETQKGNPRLDKIGLAVLVRDRHNLHLMPLF